MSFACQTAGLLPSFFCHRRKRTVCAAYDGPTRKLGDMSSVLRELASPEAIEELEKASQVPSISTFAFDEGWSADFVDEDPSQTTSTDDSDEILEGILEDPRFAALSQHTLKGYQSHQKKANAVNKASNKDSLKARRAERTTHKRLKIISGDFAGRQLKSPQSKDVRPMMKRVRAAVFDMLLSQYGCVGRLPEGSRWLDLFAGTRAEDYLKRSAETPSFAGAAFDFVSVCPPYLQVSYPELQDLLESSRVLDEYTIMFMEYPKQLSHEIRDTVGPLTKVKDRRYGRTWLAVYAAI